MQAIRRLCLTSLLVLGSFSLNACDDGLSFKVSEQQIESKMKPYFPYHKEALMGQLQLDLMEPDLILKKGSERADLVLTSQVTAGGSVWPGKLHLSFGLDYEAQTGTFYLVEPRVENMRADGVPLRFSKGIVQYILPLVQSYLTRIPVYTLNPDSGGAQNVARKTLKGIAIQDQALKVTLGWVDDKK